MITENRHGRIQFEGKPEFGQIYHDGDDEYLLISVHENTAEFGRVNKTMGATDKVELFLVTKKEVDA